MEDEGMEDKFYSRGIGESYVLNNEKAKMKLKHHRKVKRQRILISLALFKTPGTKGSYGQAEDY